MFIRYNEINKYYEYDTSGGSGVGPWLILPIDYSQIINPPIIVPPDPLPPNIAFTDVHNVFGPDQTINGDLAINSNARAAGIIRSDTAFYERLRATPVGHWQDIPFNAANFTAVGGTWTIGPAAIIRNKFTIIGLTIVWSIYISWFSGENLTGGSPTSLGITIPLGFTNPGNIILPTAYAFDGGRSNFDAAPTGSLLNFNRADGLPFNTGAAIGIIGTFTFEIVGAGVNTDV